jgi:hypothetical protein
MDAADRAKASAGDGGPVKRVMSPVEEALARQAAMRPARGPGKAVPPPARVPKVKMGRKNRRKIPKE